MRSCAAGQLLFYANMACLLYTSNTRRRTGKDFRPLYRGKHSAGIDGVGIGLSLTRDIINKQHGYIKAASDKGGSAFSIFLKSPKYNQLKGMMPLDGWNDFVCPFSALS